jgi:hypothetical protein
VIEPLGVVDAAVLAGGEGEMPGAVDDACDGAAAVGGLFAAVGAGFAALVAAGTSACFAGAEAGAGKVAVAGGCIVAACGFDSFG